MAKSWTWFLMASQREWSLKKGLNILNKWKKNESNKLGYRHKRSDKDWFKSFQLPIWTKFQVKNWKRWFVEFLKLMSSCWENTQNTPEDWQSNLHQWSSSGKWWEKSPNNKDSKLSNSVGVKKGYLWIVKSLKEMEFVLWSSLWLTTITTIKHFQRQTHVSSILNCLNTQPNKFWKKKFCWL